MSSQPRRCPTCLNIMPLARRRCPYCFHENPLNEDTRSLEVLLLQEKLAGKFEIISEIHRRGNSTLFLAQDLILDRKIALKTIKFDENAQNSLIDRWNQNLKRCLRLDEPHLARIYTYGSTGLLYYIILEFIDHETLENALSGHPSGLPIWKCLRVGRDIAQGLHAAHNMGIIHHRLTPSNVAVSRDGFSRVLDLGAAQGTIDALEQRPWSPIMDSSRYFAPEQIESGISDAQSDQYRLAAVIYQALTGRPAFENTGEEGAFARLHQDPRPLLELNPLVPQELNDIILKAMSRNPDDRFPDCHEFAIQLESLEPDYWLPDIETVYRASTPEATVALLLSEVHRNEQNREYYRGLVLCEQALTLAPYNTEVTNTMVRIQKLHEKEQHLRSLVNKALVAFYSDSLNDALATLQNGRQIDKDNPEILRLTHEVMQEQERKRLISVLLDAAKIDLAKQAFSSAMSNVIRVLDIDSRNETAVKLKQRIEIGMEERAAQGSLLTSALSAYEAQNLEEAEEILSKILSSDADNVRAKQLRASINHQKKHYLLMNLWENLDREFRCGQYRKAIEVLKQIAQVEPALKQDIRDRLVRIREKMNEQNGVFDTGDTQPLRAVRASDLSNSLTPETNSLTPETDLARLNVHLTAKASSAPEAVSASLDKTPVIQLEQLSSSDQDTPVFEQPLGEQSVTQPAASDGLPVASVRNSTSGPSGILPKGGSKPRWQDWSRSRPVILWMLATLFLAAVVLKLTRTASDPLGPQPADQPGSEAALIDDDSISVQLSPESTPTPVSTILSTSVKKRSRHSTPNPTIPPKPRNRSPVVTDEFVISILKSASNNEKLGNYDTAAALYRSVLKRDPSNQEAQVGVQRCVANEPQKNRSDDSRTPQPASNSDASDEHSSTNTDASAGIRPCHQSAKFGSNFVLPFNPH